MKFASRSAAVFSLFALLLVANPASADEPVTLQLTSGRQFKGVIDARTNDSRLWLRVSHGAVVVLKPFAWSQIAAVQGAPNSVAQSPLPRVETALSLADRARLALFAKNSVGD